MFNKKRNKFREYLYYFVLILFIFSLFVPLLLGSNYANIKTPIQNKQFPESIEISNFSKDNYNPILEDDKYGLGNITIYDIDFNDLEIGLYSYAPDYPLLAEDYNLKVLNVSYKGINFIETTKAAVVSNLNNELQDNRQITVQLNETFEFRYTTPKAGFLIYRPRLYPTRLIDVYINNGLDILKLEEEKDFYIDAANFLVFNYFNYFKISSNFNFTMYLILEYDINVDNWAISQINEEDLMIKSQQKNFTVKFDYQFKLLGKKYNESLARVPADELAAAFIVNLPDKELLANHSLILNSENVDIDDYLTSDKAINISLTDLFLTNNSEFNLNFTAKFTLKFIDAVYQTWAIDRLAYERNIRQRIYFPSIISGPSQIFLTSISMYEFSFTIDQIITADSLFERSVTYFYDNNTYLAPKITLPYLIFGEICPVLIKYVARDDLRIVVLDSIKMPVNGLIVKIYYYNQSYGTYISKDQVQLIAPLKTNENGQVTLKNVPRGNYTAEIYMEGKLIKTSDVSTYVDVNYIYTNILHIPIWIIIFGSINGFILIIGFLFYLRQKRLR